nr:MAG TPA: hypothetical protein [Inoviridae sp.]
MSNSLNKLFNLFNINLTTFLKSEIFIDIFYCIENYTLRNSSISSRSSCFLNIIF